MRFEKTGETRCPEKGEWFESSTGVPYQAETAFWFAEHPILRPVPDEPSEREQKLETAVLALMKDDSRENWAKVREVLGVDEEGEAVK